MTKDSQQKITAQRINEYAGSMFAFDNIHSEWIARCARYLVEVFGEERIRGAKVLDYAFGRGNWSLAFVMAGAAKVVSIDASEGNVMRFSETCKGLHQDRIEIRLGNVLEKEIKETFDLVWLYGILPVVDDEYFLLEKIAPCLSPEGEMLVYTYDSGSLRQRIVEAARRGLTYARMEDFYADSLLFAPSARLRARDDLTAPCIHWNSLDDLCSMITSVSLTPLRKVADFMTFSNTTEAPEFGPHHVVCQRRGVGASAGPLETITTDNSWNIDADLIGDLADWIVENSGIEKKAVSIGLFNSHFPALRHRGYEASLIDDFQFLLFAWKKLKLGLPTNETLAMFLLAGVAATKGLPRQFPEAILRSSRLARDIRDHTIRL